MCKFSQKEEFLNIVVIIFTYSVVFFATGVAFAKNTINGTQIYVKLNDDSPYDAAIN